MSNYSQLTALIFSISGDSIQCVFFHFRTDHATFIICLALYPSIFKYIFWSINTFHCVAIIDFRFVVIYIFHHETKDLYFVCLCRGVARRAVSRSRRDCNNRSVMFKLYSTVLVLLVIILIILDKEFRSKRTSTWENSPLYWSIACLDHCDWHIYYQHFYSANNNWKI